MNPIECLEKFIKENEIAGAALRVRCGEKVLCEANLGYADVEKKIRVTPDTIFRLASMTKPVISIAVLLLAEQGKLDIEDPVEKYLPVYQDMLVSKMPDNKNLDNGTKDSILTGIQLEAAERPITIGMLLSHSSGMAQGLAGMYLFDALKDFKSLEKRVNQLAHLPLDFQPGTGTGYSAGAAFDTLGRIIEVVSGEDLNSFLNNNIFEPLKISDIGFLLNPEQISRLANVYEFTDEKTLRDSTGDGGNLIESANAMRYGYFCGSGGLYGSLNAYDCFASMLLGNGEYEGTRIVKGESIKRMTTPYGTKQPMPGMDWGLGVAVFEGRNKNRWLSKGTYGWSGGLGTHFYIDPVNNIAVTLLLSRSNVAGALSHISMAVEEAVYKTFIDPNA